MHSCLVFVLYDQAKHDLGVRFKLNFTKAANVSLSHNIATWQICLGYPLSHQGPALRIVAVFITILKDCSLSSGNWKTHQDQI
eukprot:4259338-Amphidinium_carterae.1